jgi:glycerophosphoryl diester phosphodiesterase
MKIIAHRGASGLALENTLASFELATLLGVDAIELDIHITRDGKLVANHDATLLRTSGTALRVKSSKQRQVSSVLLNDGQSYVPTLQQVFDVTGSVPLIVEIKSSGCVPALHSLLRRHKRRDVTVVSFKHAELSQLQALGTHAKLVALERTKPFEIIDVARHQQFDGIGLNFWLLNPLTYWYARRAGLSIYVYTINSRVLGKLIGWLYPHVGICTDHPEWFIKHPWLKVRGSLSDKLNRSGRGRP